MTPWSASQSRAAVSTSVSSTALQIEGRAADDLEHVGGGGLLLQRLGQFAGSLFELLSYVGRAGELRRRAAVGALVRFGLVVLPCCVFVGLRLIGGRLLPRATPTIPGDTILPPNCVRASAVSGCKSQRRSQW